MEYAPPIVRRCDPVTRVAQRKQSRENCLYGTTHFDDAIVDNVHKGIELMQNRGQVVTLQGLEVMMKHWHGSADLKMIEAATEELLRQERIATLPLNTAQK